MSTCTIKCVIDSQVSKIKVLVKGLSNFSYCTLCFMCVCGAPAVTRASSKNHITQFFQLLKQQLGAKEWEKSLPPAQKQPQVSAAYFCSISWLGQLDPSPTLVNYTDVLSCTDKLPLNCHWT